MNTSINDNNNNGISNNNNNNDNNNNNGSNHYIISQPVYVPIEKYRIVDNNDTFDSKTMAVLEISATEVMMESNNNNNTTGALFTSNYEMNGNVPVNDNLNKNIELNVILLVFLLLLDTLSFFRYIYVPIVLYNFFGPIWLIFPWTIVALINYMLQILVIYYGEYGNNLYILNLHTSIMSRIRRQSRIMIPTEIIDDSINTTNDRITNIERNNIDNNNNDNNDNNHIESSNTDNPVVEVELYNSVYIPKRRMIFILTFWSIFDSIVSLITGAIAMLIVLLICQDVNGVTTGYEVYYRLLLSGIAFTLSSLAIRFIWIIYPCLCCLCNIYSFSNNFSLLGISGDNRRHNFQFRPFANKCIDYGCKFVFCISFIMFWIALGFTLACAIIYISPLTKNIKSSNFNDCDPMVPLACSLPFPSSYWLQSDSTTSTGYKVNIGPKTLPYVKKGSGQNVDPSYLNEFDGFSVSAGILWHLPGIRDEDLVSYELIKRSTLLNSTTLLIAPDTSLFPHFAERDYSNSDPEKIFYLQPAKSLKFATQYIAVIKGFKDSKGNLLQPSSVTQDYIAAYKKSQSTIASDPRYARLLTTLTYLDNHNIDLNSIQLIWDFVTASESSTLGMAKTIASNVKTKMNNIINSGQKPYNLAMVGEGSNCREYIGNGDPQMRATLYFDLEVPWLLSSSSRLKNTFDKEFIDPTKIDEMPMKGGVGLAIQVPCSVSLGLKPTAVVQFGHGIFGSKSDLERTTWLQNEASNFGWIIWSMDWRGFDIFDVPLLVKTLMHDVSLVTDIRDSTFQGFINKLTGKALIYNILDDFKQELGLDTTVNYVAAQNILLPARYIGVSMGSILGSGFVPLAGYDRAAFLVPGTPFTFVAQRSSLFLLYAILLKYQFYNQIDVRIIMNSWQLLLDPAEACGWANTNVYDNIDILAQVGLGDSTVTAIAGDIFGRNLNLTLVSPSNFDVYGMNSLIPPFGKIHNHALYQGNYPVDFANIPKTSVIPTVDSNVHSCLPSNPKIMKQTSYFIAYGDVINPCSPKICVLDKDAATC